MIQQYICIFSLFWRIKLLACLLAMSSNKWLQYCTRHMGYPSYESAYSVLFIITYFFTVERPTPVAQCVPASAEHQRVDYISSVLPIIVCKLGRQRVDIDEKCNTCRQHRRPIHSFLHMLLFCSHSAPTHATKNVNNSHLDRRRASLGCQARAGGALLFDWQVSSANYHGHLPAGFDRSTVTTKWRYVHTSRKFLSRFVR